MSIIDLKKLERINQDHIFAAGPRYSPIIDPNAPNLTIQPLLIDIEALGLTDRYRASILDLEKELVATWKGVSKDTISMFSTHEIPPRLAGLLALLRNKKAGKAKTVLHQIGGLSDLIVAKLDQKQKDLWDQEQVLEEHSDEKKAVQSEISSIRRLKDSLRKITAFISSPLSSLVSINRMLLLGEWGTGKTHFLCDITKQRMARNLPTLFFLAHRLPLGVDPLAAICSSTGIDRKPEDLLKRMNRLGRISGGRALIIIDGINEAGRAAWRKNVERVARMVARYPSVGVVLSCRVPFDKQIFTSRARRAFVEVHHSGFQEIEFDAQRAFFEYYKIPNPHIPLLTPEFSRPLFLKILCLTFSGRTSTVKKRMVQKIAEGRESMTKLFEDFVMEIGGRIEADFGLQSRTCWRLLKEHKLPSGESIGIAVSMARSLTDYISPQECLSLIRQVCGRQKNSDAQAILERLVTEGLLTEDTVWEKGVSVPIVRFPYQRFSDHLICRYLLNYYLDTSSQEAIRRSFYSSRPLGKIFEIDQFGNSYRMPGLASAMMLDFPERVKKILPSAERELVFYLPKRKRLLSPLIETFLDGLLWRDRDSFSEQTDHVVIALIERGGKTVERQTLEALACLACRPGHPYSAQRLYGYLERKEMLERDLLWSEYLRNSDRESVVYKLLDWIEGPGREAITEEVVENLSVLLSLFLTTNQRALRDRVTKVLVLMGEKYPKILFNTTLQSLAFNDPYVPERMLAACYGVLMRTWAFPPDILKTSVSIFAQNIYDFFFTTGALYSTKHILMVDYILGIIELARRIDSSCLGKRLISPLEAPFRNSKTPIPDSDSIKESDCEPADGALGMDFKNYTIGRLVADRRNYDSEHEDYQKVLRQIRWRILSLGYKKEAFEVIDRSIAERGFYQEQESRAGKTDRYGKKYAWIAFYEVAGIQAGKGFIQDAEDARLSDADIDPSFPEDSKSWKPALNQFFNTKFRSAREWTASGETPSYDHLCRVENLDGINGPWILLKGYIKESALGSDPRQVFAFLNGLLVKHTDIPKLKEKFESIEYPGNSEIPEPGTDHYTFAGEIPWSCKYGRRLRGKNCKPKRCVSEAFSGSKEVKTLKRYKNLTQQELSSLAWRSPISVEMLTPDEQQLETNKKIEAESPLEYVEVSKYIHVPGISVELPTYSFGWESYHSAENQADIGDFLAPALCAASDLRNKGGSVDLVDASGQPATLYRRFGEENESTRSTLFYVREDILRKYLVSTGQEIIWLNWGERDFKHPYLEKMRSAIQAVWSSHGHIFRKMIVGNLNQGKPI